MGIGWPHRRRQGPVANRCRSHRPGEAHIHRARAAAHERDREIWARRRLILSVLLAAGLVLMFGGLAMRNQRKELVLERELAIAALAQSRDQRLQRASRAAVIPTRRSTNPAVSGGAGGAGGV